jgi:diacylglycerol kinase family enzyme
MTAVLQTVIKNIDSSHMKVITDRETWEDDILMLVSCNGSREGGGFLIAPEASPSDNVFHYAWVEKVSRLRIFQILPEVMKGTHERFPEVRIGKFESMKVISDRVMYIHTDGEIFAGFDSEIKELDVQILPGAIETIS